MDHLWAPWRMQFIRELREYRGGCVFCELGVPGDDRERLVLHRGKFCFVLMNKYPYNNGHVMIIPYRHTGVLADLNPEEHLEMMKLCSESIEVMKKTIEAEGFNCGINVGKVAGAGIDDHVHMHVVPRWNGDNNFMPVIADTRSMPEYLLETYDRLAGGFKSLSDRCHSEP